MRCGNDSQLKICKKTKILVSFPDADLFTKFECNAMISTEILDPIIIGYDFLSKYSASINSNENQLEIDELKVKFIDKIFSDIFTVDENDKQEKTENYKSVSLNETTQTINELIEINRNFKKIGNFPNFKHSITLIEKDSLILNKRVKPFKFSNEENFIINQKIENLLDEGIIEKSVSSVCSPGFLVKRGKNNKRLVIDYTQLNKISSQSISLHLLLKVLSTHYNLNAFLRNLIFLTATSTLN